MGALFSPEVLEAGAVKGLKPSCLWRDTGGDRDSGRCWGGGGAWLYPARHCHHQNDFCIKTGSGESHFNIAIIMRQKITIIVVSTNHNF